MLPATAGMRPYAGGMRRFRGRAGGADGQLPAARAVPTVWESAADDGDDGSATVVIDRPAGGGWTAGGRPQPQERAAGHAVPPATHRTEVLDVQVAASSNDPGAPTQVLARGAAIAPVVATGAGAVRSGGLSAPRPLVTRRVAAEIGMYAGAGLVLVAIAAVAGRGWAAWEPGVRWAFAALSTVALIAAGLFVRLPWSRAVGDERRRAVSALLTTGVAVATTGVGVALGSAQGALSAGPGNAARAVGLVLAVVVVNLIARTPVSESALLVALAWATWVVVPPGPGTWAVLMGIGVAWAVLGMRWARGRLTSMLLGAALALVASVGMAGGPWAWPTRAALAGVAVVGLGAFLRGRANYWLALGAGAATALAASVAGDVVGPALALLMGGLATMAVSWVALRSARREQARDA